MGVCLRVRSERTRAAHHREAGVFVPAVDVGEAGLAQPCKLHSDGCAAVFLLAEERVGDLLLGGTEGADVGEPAELVGLFELGSGAGDVVGVDEEAAGLKRSEDGLQQGALAFVLEVMDGERRDDGVGVGGSGSVV